MPAPRALLIFAVAALLTACDSQPQAALGIDAAESAVVSAQPADLHSRVSISEVAVNHAGSKNSYVVSWRSPAPVEVYVTTDPEATPADASRIGSGVSESPLRWTSPGAPERHYFLLVSENGSWTRAASRLLPLEGGRNFRDLGGYQTENGKTVRWGHVFRSGVMNDLTDADYDYLSSLGIGTVCDYRSKDERTSEPTQWRAGEVEYVTFPETDAGPDMSFMSALMAPDATPDSVTKAMADGYADIARQYRAAYTAMFDRLAQGEIPLAFNCSAGKDRAGLSAALLLTALGVPRDTVVADYALSESYVDYVSEFLEDADEAGSHGDDEEPSSAYAFLAELPLELLQPLMRSNPLYVETALSDLEAEHGSVMAFIRNELSVSDTELASIRSALLE